MSAAVEHCKCKEVSKEEKYRLLKEIIQEYESKESNLIQILHMGQEIFGFLPLEVQKFIAEEMDIPLSRVSGVVTFYSFFSTKPRGQYTIRVCLGTACYVRGGKKIVDRLKEILEIGVGDTTADGKFTLEIMRCIGACGLAPTIAINGKVFKQVNPDKLMSILEKY